MRRLYMRNALRTICCYLVDTIKTVNLDIRRCAGWESVFVGV